MQHPIELLRLSARSYNALVKNGIEYIEQLQQIEGSLHRLPGIGINGLKEIQERLSFAKGFMPATPLETSVPVELMALSSPARSENILQTPFDFSSFTQLLIMLIDRYLEMKKKRKSFNSARHRSIIIERFLGRLSRHDKRTLETIGEKYGITRERVRQICADFMEFTKDVVSAHTSLRDRLDSLLSKAREVQVFDLNELMKMVRDVFPQVQEHETYDFLHFLEYWSDVIDITDILRANKENPVYCFGPDCSQAYRVGQLAEDLIGKQVHNFNQIIERIEKILNIDKRIIQSCLLRSKMFVKSYEYLFLRTSTKRPLSVADMLYVICKNEKRPMHFSEASSLIWKYFNEDVLPHNAQGAMLADTRFVRVGNGTYALYERGMMRGEVEDLIEEYLKSKGKPTTFREICEHVRVHRILTNGAVALAIKRSDEVIQVQKGRYALREWGGEEIHVEAKRYPIRLDDGILKVLRESSVPLSVSDISTQLKQTFGDQCSSNMKSILLTIDMGKLKTLVQKLQDGRYLLKTGENINV